jgi:hypothetical protein
MPKEKMVTVERRAVGKFNWDNHEQARIERNVFALNGRSWEGLRFCKNRDGRHNRVHLVIEEENFVELFRDAVDKGVFAADTLEKMRSILAGLGDPFRDVIGIGSDGRLSHDIDSELYGAE